MLARYFRIATIVAVGVFSAGQARAESCTQEAGAEQARIYVDQCLEVSPATRPPCNAENTCDLIIEEIVRGCEMLAEDAPEFCGDYSG